MHIHRVIDVSLLTSLEMPSVDGLLHRNVYVGMCEKCIFCGQPELRAHLLTVCSYWLLIWAVAGGILSPIKHLVFKFQTSWLLGVHYHQIRSPNHHWSGCRTGMIL